MKRVIIGTSLLISSSIVIAGITISAAIRAVEITEWVHIKERSGQPSLRINY